jgi:U4/U6 small nuclear ribonucleoprotein PRP31
MWCVSVPKIIFLTSHPFTSARSLQEPPPSKLVKALPKPDLDPRKRRGGKRVRAQKEHYAISEARKAANRMGFGEMEEDVYQEEMGFTLGALGKKGHAGGHFRVPEATNKRKGGALSKAMKKRLTQQERGGGMSTMRGLATAGTSSVAFTPVQGLEIVRGTYGTGVNPHQVGHGSDKYFSDKAGFSSLVQKGASNSEKLA